MVVSPEERYPVFDQLQARMLGNYRDWQQNYDDESVVVVPSVSLDLIGGRSGTMMQAYEERFLFMLLLLRQPRLRVVYVTSMPIAPTIIEYYLALLAGVIPSHAQARLSLVSIGDATPRPLSQKLLERPQMLRRIAALIPNRVRCHLIPYNTTETEVDIAVSLGIPMYGADPRLNHLGTKTGGRRLFEEEGVRHPIGREDLHSVDELADAVVSLRAERPSMAEMIVKLNEGVSGMGNALLDLRGLPAPGAETERDAVSARLGSLEPEGEGVTVEDHLAKLPEWGGIVEERITGAELRSPSVQLRVLPDGEVELLSTHDQVLGGPSGQSYLGCRFPADPAYAPAICAAARTIGERLAREGVLGRFALDFVVVRDEAGRWSEYAIEINLRKGGTTHPFLTLQFLTNGRYDEDSGAYLTADGREKHLVATDHLEAGSLRALAVDDLFDVVARNELHFDQTRQEGVVFHMISCLTESGRIGLTAVGDTADHADEIYGRAEKTLVSEAEAALEELSIPPP